MMFGLEEESTLVPFTLEDAIERKFCENCSYRNACPIIVYVNKLRLKRDGKSAASEFGCTLHKELEGYEIPQDNEDEELS